MNIYDMKGITYEEEFEFPLWRLIKERAKKKNISYSAALAEVVPEYELNLRYRDDAYVVPIMEKRHQELVEMEEKERLEESEDLWSFLEGGVQ